jgi:hypothetical protein
LDIDSRNVGQVANLYIDDDGELQFVNVIISGFMGLRTKYRLVPVEAIAEEGAGSIALEVDQQDVESGPTHTNRHAGPAEALQDITREYYGY